MPSHTKLRRCASALPLRRSDGCDVCDVCRNMNFEPCKLTRFSRRAKQGCPLCSVIQDAIRSLAIDWDAEDEDNIFAYSHATSGSESGGISIYRDTSDGFVYLPDLNIFSLPDAPSSWKLVPLAYDIPTSTRSVESFDWIRQQLQECAESHTECRSISRPSLPKRVIDVDAFAQDVRLVESPEPAKRYACLSHCWGKLPSALTTSANYSVYTNRIPWPLLSKTFQDAVTTVRRLGIRYLWIDSLCIIQDDQEDWERESSKMSTVYEQAYLTLAALKSPSGDGGLFADAPAKYRAHELRYTTKAGEVYVAFARRNIPHNPFFPEFNVGDDLIPLMQRAWVFQERLLSARVVFFGSHELYWICKTHSACQCSGVREDRNTDAHFTTKRSYNAQKNSRYESYRNLWHDLVEQYSQLALTFEKDVFPAISAVVKDMQRSRTDPYVAGLWQGDLHRDLLWKTVWNRSSLKLPRRPSTWRAPSWSWASVLAQVEFDTNVISEFIITRFTDTDANFADILDIWCAPKGPDPAGELTSAFLLVSGYLGTAVLEYENSAPRNGSHDSNSEYRVVLVDGRSITIRADYELSERGWGFVPPGTVVYLLMMIFGYRRDSEGDKSHRTVTSMVLRLVGDDALEFERIGIAQIPYHNDCTFPFEQERRVVKII